MQIHNQGFSSDSHLVLSPRTNGLANWAEQRGKKKVQEFSVITNICFLFGHMYFSDSVNCISLSLKKYISQIFCRLGISTSSQITQRCITSIVPSCNPHFQTSLFAITLLQYVDGSVFKDLSTFVFKDTFQIFKYFDLIKEILEFWHCVCTYVMHAMCR